MSNTYTQKTAETLEMIKDPTNPQFFRQVMGRYPTGVALITALEEDETPVGMVVGTFASVSLDPPMVSFMPARTSTSWPRIKATGRFVVNVLGATQEQVCRSFSGRGGTKFEDIPWIPSPEGAPLLEDAVAWMDCRLEDVFDGGDHEIVLGLVEHMDIANTELPLLFFQGGYGQFTPHSMATAGPGLEDQLALVDRARPEIETLAQKLGCDCLIGGRTDREIVLLASAGLGNTEWIPAVVGKRLPLAAPVGRTAMAWAEPQEIEAWINSGAGVDSTEMRTMLSKINERGYSISVDAVGLEADVISGGRLDAREVMDPGTEALEPTTTGQVHSIAAPIFGMDGEVVLIASLYGLPHDMSSSEVDRYAAELLATSQKISQNLPVSQT